MSLSNRINKVYTALSKKLFFNLGLRMFLEGYIEYAISSLMNLMSVSLSMGLIPCFHLAQLVELE
jgi:hypothetical protein